MTTDARCVHEMLPGQCGICRRPARPVVQQHRSGFLARYDGWCTDCGAEIEKGRDRIVRDPEGEGYVHESCT